jgi:hypothetical protein
MTGLVLLMGALAGTFCVMWIWTLMTLIAGLRASDDAGLRDRIRAYSE